jgi:extracellular elastinolytic metalloproteinase
MLHNVYAALVKKHGYSKSARTKPEGKEGNVIFLHLMLDALAIQPCNPKCKFVQLQFDFEVIINHEICPVVDARDAWIQADRNRYEGANKCLLWKVFASRGLGINAVVKPPYRDGGDVPSECRV